MTQFFRSGLMALVLGSAAAAGWAADPAAADKTPQQNRMAQCNQDAKAKALKGDERKAFMKDCLSGKPVAAAPAEKTATAPATGQQGKMKACNDQAKGKKGDERKAFMAECLKA